MNNLFLYLLIAVVTATGCTVQHPVPDLAGQDVHLTVVHTADLHSRFLPYYFAPGQIDKGLGLIPKTGQSFAVVGGIGRVSTVVKCIRGIYTGPPCDALEPLIGPPAARSIHVDSGDIWEGAPVFNQFNGEVEMRAMSEIGLTAMALGNHEFDKGSVNLEEQYQKFGGFPILAANYEFSDPNDYTQPKLDRIIRDSTSVNVGGLRIGIIGLGNLSSIEGIIEGGNTLGVRPIDATQAITNAVQVMRPSVDVLALVSHLGLDEDEGVAAGAAESRDQNTAVAVDGKSGVKAYTYRIIPIDDSIPSDPVMDNMLEPYQLKMNAFLNLNQVYAVVPCPTANAGSCPKTQRNDNNGGDSQLGNLVATAMRIRQGVEADYGVTNSLGIRADFESGPLNLEEMYNVFPFDNTITTMELSGDETQQMLDFIAARSAERGCRTQAQVSGIYFDAICASDDTDCNTRLGHPGPCAKNIYLGDHCRMPDGTFNNTPCKAIDPYGEYRVAVNDYIANGGSGFAVLKRNTTKFNTGISLRDALVDYIRTLPNRCTDPTMFTNIVGVHCKDKQAETYDCTSQCSGDANFAKCQSMLMSPEKYDYTDIACLGQDVNAHDGRIQMFSTAEN
ncbi:MAG: 5'-nucleotidase C-terminal domain-containing protein [Myxococcales bacterium]|nr:5'-nucleotidase C-terminal domain-containing protein [Myxococcales bacterium]